MIKEQDTKNSPLKINLNSADIHVPLCIVFTFYLTAGELGGNHRAKTFWPLENLLIHIKN